MHVTLIVVGGIHKGRQIPVTTPEFLIGRAARCHLRPVREDVSREHCAVLRRGERVFLRDLASRNGTILNRRKLVQGETPVTDGDEFDVGPLRFRVAVTPQAIPASAPPAEDDSCFDANEIYSGLPGEQAPTLDDTIEITRPLLAKPPAQKPPTDEIEKLF